MQGVNTPVALNDAMVARLTAEGHVRRGSIDEALRTVLRHWFLPEVALDEVYSGAAISIALGDDMLSTSSSSEPGIMARMLEQLSVERGDRILEVGTGSGYNAALLATLSGPSGAVTTIDLDETIVARARGSLTEAGFDVVNVVMSDGWLGAEEGSPYDSIVVTASVWDVSREWHRQLKPGGILTVPLWLRAGVQASVAFIKVEDGFRSRSLECCGFMPLRGPHAGPERYFAVDGWAICLDSPSTLQKESLELLLASEPVRRPIDPPPDGWFERFAFDEPNAAQMWTTDAPWPRVCHGLLLTEHESLALVEGGELLSYGSSVAADSLEAFLMRVRGLNVSALLVEAFPPERPAPPHDWLLRRPDFSYSVRERVLPAEA
jgi:protein-L-isoaspartate(D-aspartate) O-methyltransferase